MRLLVVALLFSSLVAGQSQPPPPATPPATSQPPAPATTPAPNQGPATAPAMPEARAQDVDTVDHVIAALYDVISGPAGARDWDRFRSLFIPEARLIPNAFRPDGSTTHRVLSPADYVERARNSFAQQGFFENEAARSQQQFANIVHAFSTYESRREKGAQPFARGINSIQLLSDGKRWYVVTIMWQAEDASHKLPAEYLKSGAQ